MTGANFDALRSVLAGMHGDVLSLGGRRGHRALAAIHHLASGRSLDDADLRAALASDRVARPEFKHNSVGKSVAVLTAYGIATPKLEMQPWAFSTALLARNISALAADASIEAIMVCFDTPGGAVTGTIEAANAIWEARKRKPVIGAIDSLAASAGFWLASQCTHLVAIGETASCGAIGVFLLHIDASRAYDAAGLTPLFIVNEQSPHKVDGNSMQPASDSFQKFEQREVNELGRKFIAAVARGRAVSAATVETTFGQGRVLRAPDAKRLGMIDSIGSIDSALRLAANPSALRAHQVDAAKARATTLIGWRADTSRARRLEVAKARARLLA